MKYLIIVIFIVIGCSSGNLEYVKSKADETFNENGFKILGYSGYQCGLLGFNDYGGANVWYILEKIPSDGIIYSAALKRWGSEIHIYNIEAIDAIKPNN